MQAKTYLLNNLVFVRKHCAAANDCAAVAYCETVDYWVASENIAIEYFHFREEVCSNKWRSEMNDIKRVFVRKSCVAAATKAHVWAWKASLRRLAANRRTALSRKWSEAVVLTDIRSWFRDYGGAASQTSCPLFATHLSVFTRKNTRYAKPFTNLPSSPCIFIQSVVK